MPIFFENLGLNFMQENEDTLYNFMRYLALEGKGISGYCKVPAIYKKLGDIEFYLKNKRNNDGILEAVGLDAHCCGPCVWKMVNVGIDITPEDSLPTERVFLFKKYEDNLGLVPVHLIKADVLPSFLEDDVVTMQICAFTIDVNYYSDEDDYANHQPKGNDGQHILLANGALFPASYLYNHTIENKSETDFSNDDHVMFMGTVKALYYGTFELGGKEEPTFIRCIIETQFGELQLTHTIEQVAQKQRDNLKVGSIVSGVCVISGDVGILEYENGIVRNLENNIRLLRQCMLKGQAERLRTVLCDDAEYVSKASEKTYKGADEIIERLNYIYNNCNNKCFAVLATITEVDGDDLEYTAGTQCIAISYKTEDNYQSVAFIDLNDEGNIKRINITSDERYHFKVK